MITYDDIISAQNALVDHWGEDGKKVIEACFNANATKMTNNEFLDHCSACGGNWGGMFLSGIKRLYPNVWDAIPNNMGSHAIICIFSVMTLLKIED